MKTLTYPTSFLLVFLLSLPLCAKKTEQKATTYETKLNISYYDDHALANADEYKKSHCKMDMYYPENRAGFPTIVWFHGGGLTGGKRRLPALKNQGIALVAVSYRLSPKGEFPCFLEDAAAATAWVIKNIAAHGGDPDKVFIAGHSAGGYLSAMVGMDERWLAAHGISNRKLAGIIPVSAQVTTHFLVKKLRGDRGEQYRPIIDEYAPLYHASKNLPPICLIVGDRRIEWKSRVEENELLAVSLKNLGHEQTEFYEMGGLNHRAVGEGAMIIIKKYVNRIIEERGKEPSP
ncbi:acetyl esterase/lipase [Ereboglobus sp. PH5-5]|uniref:alpha/beta hydrolase n=1 Tax=unclassified Ereboglobus TaxID=2626932 RepID=UPI00240725B4|nr:MULTISPECIES: alpha/beta hydrolase [unclassified Ereboglobus]MDF9827009.1 acetyl esterase/lipase [Ereboglobus sp. PH5-10]MDF9832031.1 acetyl esterase/lipase [Ereboglobus sp. PH5-5]